MDFWKSPSGKSHKVAVRNDTVETTVDAGKKELEVTGENSCDSLDT
jgi:hypothetical protein